MPITSATRQIVAQEVGAGNLEDDFATLILTVAKGAGLTMTSENSDITTGLEDAD